MVEGGGDEKASGSSPLVFISYASQDAVVADAVVGALERAGLKCWIAPRDVVPGAHYADEIVRAINEAKVVVLILSEAAAASSHVGREIERASSKGRRILTIRRGDFPLPRTFEYFLSESQWIDVGPGGIEAAASKLIDAVRCHLAPEPIVEPNVPIKRHVPGPRPFARQLRWIVAAAVVVALWLAYLIIDNAKVAGYATASQVTGAAINVSNKKSIAVLPFTDMSEKKDQEYFADGMAEEVLDLLAKIPAVSVIGRTSSFQFKGKSEDLRTIGSKLGVAYVLEGSVRRSGDRLRITAQLVDVDTGADRWSESYERNVEDVLKVQDDIAVKIVRALQVRVGATELGHRSAPRNIDAYFIYLQGQQARDRSDQAGLEEAETDYQKALELDPSFALAILGLAETHSSQAGKGFVAESIGFEKARREAATALKLDPTLGEAHALLGDIHRYFDWDWAAADAEIKRALSLEPHDPDTLTSAASLAATLAHWDESVRFVNAALVEEPFDPGFYDVMGITLYNSGRLDAAEIAFRKILDISPTYVWAHYYLGCVLLARGEREAALAEMRKGPPDTDQLAGLPMALFAVGRRAEADAALARLIRDGGKELAFEVAETYAYRGERTQAFVWLDRAYEQRDSDLARFKGDPLFRNLEGDTRYKAFLRKMNLPE